MTPTIAAPPARRVGQASGPIVSQLLWILMGPAGQSVRNLAFGSERLLGRLEGSARLELTVFKSTE